MQQKYSITDYFMRRFGKLTAQVLILILIFFSCIFVFFKMADMIFEDNNLAFDNHVFALINPYINSTNTAIISFITFFGSQNFLLPANLALIGFFIFYKKNRSYSLKIAAVSITSTAVLFLLKYLLQRERPLVPLISKAHGYSFPSGHSFSSLVFFGMLIYITYKTVKKPVLKWVIIFLMAMLTLMVGFSRIYLKLHYASDVIAGFSLGIIWLLLAKWLLLKAEPVLAKQTGLQETDQPGM